MLICDPFTPNKRRTVELKQLMHVLFTRLCSAFSKLNMENNTGQMKGDFSFKNGFWTVADVLKSSNQLRWIGVYALHCSTLNP